MESRRLIAKNLKDIRLTRRLSQEELAHIADIDRTYVSGLERCQRNPTVDLLDKLAGVLEVKTVDFFNETSLNPIPAPLPRGRKQKSAKKSKKKGVR